ncbi:hypothetical protein OQA88_166 [Cercophora sp. LCS_1]
MKRSREPEEDIPDATSPAAVNSPSPRSDDTNLSPAAKITELDPSSTSDTNINMRCSLPPHKEPLLFTTYSDYESHYQKAHTNRCVHIEESHDSFVMVKRERGDKTYSCFVEGCERKCSTPQKRRMHLIDKHMYPKNFFFAVTRDGIDGRRSLLNDGSHRRRRSSAATTTSTTGAVANAQPGPQDAGAKPSTGPVKTSPPPKKAAEAGQPEPEQKPDVEMDDLAGAMSALQFVPPSIRFGRGGRRTGFAKR